MFAVPSKTDFCKVSTLYDMSNFFKLHSKSFGMDPSAPVMIGIIIIIIGIPIMIGIIIIIIIIITVTIMIP